MGLISAPLFAFGFANPWLLGGLAFAGLPILIHLLHKRRFHETSWAAMRFLMEAARKNSRRLRLEQLLLLIVRTLILLLLVLALSRPYVESLGAYFQTEATTHRIIVVDTSYSMGYRTGELNRLQRAQEVALQIVEAATRGDAFNVLRIADSEPRAVVREASYQQREVASEISGLKVTDESGDLVATLREVLELLRSVPDVPLKEVSIISDLQSRTWLPDSSGARSQIQVLLHDIGEFGEVVLFDAGRDGAVNDAVTSLSTDEPYVTTGHTVPLAVTLQNFGGGLLKPRRLEMFVNGQLVQTQSVEIPPGGTVTVDWSLTFEQSGEYTLEVQLEDDALPIDNHRWLTLPVKDQINVLLVNGVNAGDPRKTATYHLEKALSPATRDHPWPGLLRPRVVSESELPTIDLELYDCVFLANVGLLTEREADLLSAYVKSGGGLVVTLGDQVQSENYNLRLFKDGTGILPAKLGNRMGDAAAKNDAFQFDAGDFDHPVVKEFQGNPGSGLETTLIFEYIQATLAETSNARVALRYTSGDPAIIDLPIGEGRCLLITTSIDDQWGTWAVWAPSFVPLMHETVRHAVSRHWNERRLLVGETISRSFAGRMIDMPVTVIRPDKEQAAVRLEDNTQLATARYAQVDRSGPYELRYGPPLNRSELFAANIDARESDLTKLEEADVRAELFRDTEMTYRTQWQEYAGDVETVVVERGGLTRWLLMAVFSLLLVEQMMAWKFSYGFWLLYAFVGVAFVRQAWAVQPIAGVVSTCVLLMACAGIVYWRKRREQVHGV